MWDFLAGQLRATERGHFPKHIELAGGAFGQFEKRRPHLVRIRTQREGEQEDRKPAFHRCAVLFAGAAAFASAASSTAT